MITLQDILAAAAGALNGISQSVMAMSFGFAMIPSALAYLVGIIGCLVFNSTVPISFQADTMVMAGTIGRNRKERLSMVFIAGLVMAFIGAFGFLDNIIDFAGERVTTAMMAGVCIIMAKVSVDMVKDDKKVGPISMALGILVYMFTKSLVYTCVISVVGSTIADRVFNKNKEKDDMISQINDKIKLEKPIFNLNVLRGVLSLICITIGGNIAFTKISCAISGVTGNSDHVSIYSGLADSVSSLFGGSPISIVLAPTAAAPNPKWSAIILMGIMALFLGTGLISKVAKYIPSCSVSGTLFVIAIIMSLPSNLQNAFTGATPAEALAGSIAMIVTALIDPFFGMVAGIVVNVIVIPLGLA